MDLGAPSSVGEARHGYSPGRWANATGGGTGHPQGRAQGTGHRATEHRAPGTGPTCNPVCISSGSVKTAPARKEGAVGHSGLRIQNAGCHFPASAGSDASQRLPRPRLIALQAGRLSPDDSGLARSQGTADRCPRQSWQFLAPGSAGAQVATNGTLVRSARPPGAITPSPAAHHVRSWERLPPKRQQWSADAQWQAGMDGRTPSVQFMGGQWRPRGVSLGDRLSAHPSCTLCS